MGTIVRTEVGMTKINWKRKFLRVWMVLGLLWLIFSSSRASINIKNFRETHDDNFDWVLGIDFYLAQGTFVFLPPIAVLLLGFVILWIMKKTKSDNTGYH